CATSALASEGFDYW
nr:immunoglobulin heavy chain junction region [Macaca mulatta]